MYVDNNEPTQLNKKVGISISGDFVLENASDTIIRYLLNGIILFLITYGCIECYCSSFKIEYHKAILGFVLFILSMAYSFMHINEKTHRIGYIVILISYIYVVLKLKLVIKSGFARIVNSTFKRIQDKLFISKTKQFTEYVSDYKMAVTLCLIVIGFVVLLMLNILISEYVSIIGTIVLTLFFVASGFYFEIIPNLVSLIMYISGIIGVFVMNLNGRSNVHSGKLQFDKKNIKEKCVYEFNTTQKIHGQMLLMVVFVGSICTIIAALCMKKDSTNSVLVNQLIKGEMDKSIILAVAYSGNGNEDIALAGGLSEGRLGDITTVMYDHKTDLKLRFVPTMKEDIYLRSYIGSIYKNNRWSTMEDADEESYRNIMYGFENIYGISANERYHWTTRELYGNDYNRIVIENVGANTKYPYLPYYSYLNQKCMTAISEDYIGVKRGVYKYDLKFYPDINNKEITNIVNQNDDSIWFEYNRCVQQIYTQIPEKNKKVLKEVCEKEGFSKEDKNIVNKIQAYFQREYVYSLSCGVTPNSEDFVNYFLKTKKGFCAHFASAGALILRYLGIPARYVEGYVVTKDMFNSGKTIENEDTTEYISNINGRNSSVVEVEVADDKAHAWIEVYVDNFGWVPYEMTYYSRKEEADTTMGIQYKEFDGDAIKYFYKLLSLNFRELGGGIKNIVIVLGIFILISMLMWLIKLIIFWIIRIRSFNNENVLINICNLYEYLKQVMAFCGYEFVNGMTMKEYFEEIGKDSVIKEDVLNKLLYIIQKGIYSNEAILGEEYKYVKDNIENIIKMKYNCLSLKDKIRFRLIYNL